MPLIVNRSKIRFDSCRVCCYCFMTSENVSFQGKEIFIQHSLVAIPTRTEEEIRDHEDWYQSYLSLNEKKKESIKKWRKKKEVITL